VRTLSGIGQIPGAKVALQLRSVEIRNWVEVGNGTGHG
jgi:hypothetical protein